MITEILITALIIFTGLIPAAMSVWILTTEKHWFAWSVIILCSPFCFWLIPLWTIEVAQDILSKL